MSSRKIPLIAAALFLAAFALYLFSTRPDASWGDAPDFVMAAHGLGVAHSTGYPLTTHLGRLALYVPAGTPSFRVALLSVLPAALAVAAFFAVATLLQVAWPVAAAAAAWFALSRALWSQVGGAEVYALSALCVILAVALAVSRTRRALPLFCLFSALALCNHAGFSAVALLGGLFLLARDLRRGVRALPVCILLTFLGFTLYTSLPLSAARIPMANWDDPETWGRFITLVTGSEFYSVGILSVTSMGAALKMIVAAIGPVACIVCDVLALIACFSAPARRSGAALLLLLVIAYTLIALLYFPTAEYSSFFLPGFVSLALVALLGFSAVFRAWNGRPAMGAVAAAGLIATAAIVSAYNNTAPGQNLMVRDDNSASLYADALMRSARRDALVRIVHIHQDPIAAPLSLQSVTAVRPDLFFVHNNFLLPPFCDNYVLSKEKQAAAGGSNFQCRWLGAVSSDDVLCGIPNQPDYINTIDATLSILLWSRIEQVSIVRVEGVLFRLYHLGTPLKSERAAIFTRKPMRSTLLPMLGSIYYIDRAFLDVMNNKQMRARAEAEISVHLNNTPQTRRVKDWIDSQLAEKEKTQHK